MSTLHEVETAADAPPRSEQELLLRHLTLKLRAVPALRGKPAAVGGEGMAWPDYDARLRAIYGDQVMPSMVLAERETAAW